MTVKNFKTHLYNLEGKNNCKIPSKEYKHLHFYTNQDYKLCNLDKFQDIPVCKHISENFRCQCIQHNMDILHNWFVAYQFHNVLLCILADIGRNTLHFDQHICHDFDKVEMNIRRFSRI